MSTRYRYTYRAIQPPFKTAVYLVLIQFYFLHLMFLLKVIVTNHGDYNFLYILTTAPLYATIFWQINTYSILSFLK